MNAMFKERLREISTDFNRSRYEPMKLLSDADLTETKKAQLCLHLEKVAAKEFGQDFSFEAQVISNGDVIVEQFLTVVDELTDINKQVSRQAISKFIGKKVEVGHKIRNRVHPELCEGLEEIIKPATITLTNTISVEEKKYA